MHRLSVRRFFPFIVVSMLLLTTATVSAHPVIVPNEIIGSIGVFIDLIRVGSLALTSGWMAYSLLDPTAPAIDRRWYTAIFGLVLISLWSDLALDWARSNDVTIEGAYFSFNPQYLNVMMQSDRAPIWLLRIIGALLLGVPLLMQQPVARWIVIFGGLVVALTAAWAATTPATFTAASMAVVTPGGELGQLASQGLHLYLAALWFGGVIAVLVIRRQSEPATLAASMRAFVRYTQFFLAAMVITGLVLAWVRIGSVPALLQTGYGWLTLLKTGVIVGLMTLGSRWTADQNSIERTLLIQGGLLVVALVASAMLTTLTSARSLSEWRSDEYFHSFDNSFYDSRIERPLEIDLLVMPGLIGENRVVVTLIDSEVGLRLDDAQRVEVRLAGTSSTNTPTSLTLEPAGDGNYVAVATLTDSGNWTAEVDVSRPDIERSSNFAFTLNVPPPDLPSLLSVEQPDTFSPFDRMVSIVSGVLLVLLGASELIANRRRWNSHGIVIVLSGLCAVIGLTLLVTSVL